MAFFHFHFAESLWTDYHFSKYYKVKNSCSDPYIEVEHIQFSTAQEKFFDVVIGNKKVR